MHVYQTTNVVGKGNIEGGNSSKHWLVYPLLPPVDLEEVWRGLQRLYISSGAQGKSQQNQSHLSVLLRELPSVGRMSKDLPTPSTNIFIPVVHSVCCQPTRRVLVDNRKAKRDQPFGHSAVTFVVFSKQLLLTNAMCTYPQMSLFSEVVREISVKNNVIVVILLLSWCDPSLGLPERPVPAAP